MSAIFPVRFIDNTLIIDPSNLDPKFPQRVKFLGKNVIIYKTNYGVEILEDMHVKKILT